ncbi:MAG: EAL domain-containing protein, partial [Bacilli bacterium]|nr:EAL domain-containing protein [Bacilli bacterium]
GFKQINDTLGFAKGNEFLIELGEKIAAHFGDRLTARVSDDHFVAFALSGELEEKIATLSEEVRQMGKDLHIQLKVGGYLYRDAEENPRRAIDKARYACASVKHRGDKHYQEYDKKMHDAYHTLQYVTNHIDEAVEKGWVRPYYQPVVFSSGRELCGVEALARWVDPMRGFLNPGQFIPVLENTRLVHKLDTCIIETVCKDLKERLDAGLPCVPISINFSRLDFELMDAVEVLDSLVRKYDVPKDMLHVEITESALSENVSLLSNAVRRLKEKGYAIWLDDFGSGYSSLNVLKEYDFDVLKLDMKFLTDFGTNPKAQPLIKASIEMAGKIGLKTLCEGVETMEQADFLERAGCLRLQGWLYGKAVPKEELVAKIDSGEFKVRIEE